jgi:hypothetical protein
MLQNPNAKPNISCMPVLLQHGNTIVTSQASPAAIAALDAATLPTYLLLSTSPSPTYKISTSLAQHPGISQPKYQAQSYRAKLVL